MITLYGFFFDIAALLVIITLMYRGYRKSPNTLTLYFLIYFIPYTLFFAAFAMPFAALIKGTPQQFAVGMDWGYIYAHVFLYLSFSAMALIVGEAFWKRGKMFLFWASMVAGIVVTIVNIMYPNTAMLDIASNVTLMNAQKIVGTLIGIYANALFLPTVILFAWQGFKQKGAFRVRSLILAAGFLVLGVGGPLHDLATTPGQFMLADVLSTVANITIGVGALYRGKGAAATPAQPSVSSNNPSHVDAPAAVNA